MGNKNKPKLVAKPETEDVVVEITDTPAIKVASKIDDEEVPEGYLKLPPMMDLILFHLSSVTFANEFYRHDAEYRYAFISECMKALTRLMNEEGE